VGAVVPGGRGVATASSVALSRCTIAGPPAAPLSTSRRSAARAAAWSFSVLRRVAALSASAPPPPRASRCAAASSAIAWTSASKRARSRQ
jgi:hypothetical protein